jgi:hypothetical protein
VSDWLCHSNHLAHLQPNHRQRLARRHRKSLSKLMLVRTVPQ